MSSSAQHIWTDGRGRDWSTAVTVNTVRRVKQLTGVDLLEVFDGKLMAQLAIDPVLLANVLYAVSKPQADERGVSDEEFGELLAGESIERATEALVQGIIDFFPPARRSVLERLWRATSRADAEAVKLAQAKLSDETIDTAIRRMIREADDEIDRELSKFGGSFGSLPEPSASIPDR